MIAEYIVFAVVCFMALAYLAIIHFCWLRQEPDRSKASPALYTRKQLPSPKADAAVEVAIRTRSCKA